MASFCFSQLETSELFFRKTILVFLNLPKHILFQKVKLIVKKSQNQISFVKFVVEPSHRDNRWNCFVKEEF